MSKDNLFKKALDLTVAKFNYHSLKKEQETCIQKLVVDREDVFDPFTRVTISLLLVPVNSGTLVRLVL